MNKFNDSLSQYARSRDQSQVQQTFRKVKAQQMACLQLIDNKCLNLQDSIQYLQKTISTLQSKLKKFSRINDEYKIGELRDKQKQFIIFQLEKKCKRLEDDQESIQSLLMEKDNLINNLQEKVTQLTLQNVQIKQQLSKKIKQVKQLIRSNSQLKVIQGMHKRMASMSNLNPVQSNPVETTLYVPNLSQVSVKKQQQLNRNQYYEEVQSKLKEMEDCLNGEIEQYKTKNVKLEQEIKRLNQQLKKESANIRKVYELEIKIKNMQNQNKSLQQSYTNQLSITNQTQIKYRKKINELKQQIVQVKKQIKLNNKQTEKQLRKLSSTVLKQNYKSTLFIGTTSINELFEQLAIQIQRCHKRQINQINYQKDAIIQQLTLNLQNNKSKVDELNATIQKMKLRKNQLIEKSPLMNGHMNVNKSNHSKAQIQSKQKQKEKQKQKLQKIEQKYQQIVKQLQVKLQNSQKYIREVRIKYDEQETDTNNKMLKIQSQLAQKQMELKYNQQKYNQLKFSNQQDLNNIKANLEKQVKKAKQKNKQLQLQRDQIKQKYKQLQQKLHNKQKQLKQVEKKEKQRQQKAKKLQKKYEAKQLQYKKSIDLKDKNIEQLINKNTNFNIQIKVSKQKIKILQSNVTNLKQQLKQPQTDSSLTQTKNNMKLIQTKYTLQKQQLQLLVRTKQQMIQQLKVQIQEKVQQIKKRQQKISQLNTQINKIQNDMKLLKNQNDLLKQKQQRLKTSQGQSQKVNNFALLRQQYQKRQKMLKSQGQKIIMEAKNSKKQAQIQSKNLAEQVQNLKKQNKRLKDQINQFQQEKLKFDAIKFKDSERQRKFTKEYEQKISKLNSKIIQLQKIGQKSQNFNPVKNPSNINKLASFGKDASIKKFKDTDSKQYVQFGTQTQYLQKKELGINTIDIFALQTQNNGAMNKILDFNQSQTGNQKQGNVVQQEELKNSNLFMNLNQNEMINDNVFEICDQQQQVNLEQNQLKLHIRELFTNLRIQIEKMFNQQQISFATTKLLPKGLQDDYYELMSYIKQKIAEIKVYNEISFIMAEPGNVPQQPQEVSLQLPGMIERHASEGGGESLRKVLEEKQALINSLMNERNSQQNTINQLTMQKQQIEQQNENRFMNQCNVYKKQIKQHKKTIDILQMNFQSMKNIIRNVLQAFCQNEDMEDDLRESMTIYARVGKLTQKERSRINYYLQRYLQIKGLTQ